MKKKIIVAMCWIPASGYVVTLCFAGMNMSSDLTYISGILGLLLWFVLITPLIYKKLYKERKRDTKNESDVKSGVFVGPSSGLHNEDRPGNGGDRSRPERKSKRRTGHSAKDGEGMV